MGCKGSKQPPTTPADAKQSLATETAVAAGGQKKPTKPSESSYALFLMPSDDSLKQARASSSVFKKVLGGNYGEKYFKKCCKTLRYPLHMTLCNFAGKCDAPAPRGPHTTHHDKHGSSLTAAARSAATAAGTSPYQITKDKWILSETHAKTDGDKLYLFKIKKSDSLQQMLHNLKTHFHLWETKKYAYDLHVSFKFDQYISKHASEIMTMLGNFHWEVCVVEIPHDDKRNALQKCVHFPLMGPK